MLGDRTVATFERIHRLTTAEYDRMVASGALDDVRVELLDGLLVDMNPPGPDHVRIVRELTRRFGARSDLLHVQSPLSLLDGCSPEPDVALAPMPVRGGGHVRTASLVVEVAVSSQDADRAKATVYARAAIPRYWLVDVPAACVVEHLDPAPEAYRTVRELRGDDVLDPHVDGVVAFTVTELLGG